MPLSNGVFYYIANINNLFVIQRASENDFDVCILVFLHYFVFSNHAHFFTICILFFVQSKVSNILYFSIDVINIILLW